MEKAKLLEAVKALNAAVYEDEAKDAKAQLIETKIKFVAVKQPDIEDAFLKACESISDANQEFAPPIVGEVYEALYAEREAAKPEKGAEEVEATEGAIAEAPATTKADKKAKKEKVAKTAGEKKTSNLPAREKDKYGNVVGSMSGAMNALLEKGATQEAVVAGVAKDFSKDAKKLNSKFKGRIKHLEEAGHVIVKKDGVYTLKVKK